MRTLILFCLLLLCSALPALEPRDEELLQSYLENVQLLPGAIPVGYEHKFEVGDLQEAEVLDRGVYRTIRLHVVAKLGDEFVCEVHNGRGLVVAGLSLQSGCPAGAGKMLLVWWLVLVASASASLVWPFQRSSPVL